MKATIREHIDRIVESSIDGMVDEAVSEAIRRCLPGIMNEVLMSLLERTARASSDDTRGRQGHVPQKKKRTTSSEGRRARPQRDLRSFLDESAGSEMYQVEEDPQPSRDESVDTGLAMRLSALPPEIRALTDDMSFNDEPPASDVIAEGQKIGLDFKKMSRMFSAKNVQPPSEDIAMKEENLRRHRERLSQMKVGE